MCPAWCSDIYAHLSPSTTAAHKYLVISFTHLFSQQHLRTSFSVLCLSHHHPRPSDLQILPQSWSRPPEKLKQRFVSIQLQGVLWVYVTSSGVTQSPLCSSSGPSPSLSSISLVFSSAIWCAWHAWLIFVPKFQYLHAFLTFRCLCWGVCTWLIQHSHRIQILRLTCGHVHILSS